MAGYRGASSSSATGGGGVAAFAMRVLVLLTLLPLALAAFAFALQWHGGMHDPTLSLHAIDGGGRRVIGVDGAGGGTPAVQQSSCSNTHASPSLALSDRRQSTTAPVRFTRRDHLRASSAVFREKSPPASSRPPDAPQ
jgi:hypothetical protein